jgi:metal-responsive CopG/Arc/MetJ family transcriptional regulator
MGKLLVEVDDEILMRLEQVAPDRSTRRSEFVSTALRRALWEVEEHETAEAYARQPDSADEAYVDPEAWES